MVVICVDSKLPEKGRNQDSERVFKGLELVISHPGLVCNGPSSNVPPSSNGATLHFLRFLKIHALPLKDFGQLPQDAGYCSIISPRVLDLRNVERFEEHSPVTGVIRCHDTGIESGLLPCLVVIVKLKFAAA
jgi:hypothetical protein